jgi:FtsH-binding integral membrane protein
MRSTSERAAAIMERTQELKRKSAKTRASLTIGLSAAACLAVIVAVALAMPEFMSRQIVSSGSGFAGAAAGVFARSEAAGYVLIGLLAFALGCCLTILCYRIRRKSREERSGRDNR